MTDEVSRQSPVPTSGPEGSDLRSVANRIEGLLDDDGHYNPNPDQISRGHPDYNPEDDPRETGGQSGRDERGRFTKQAASEAPEDDQTQEIVEDEQEQQIGDEQTEDTEQQAGDTDDAQTESAIDEATTDEADTGTIQTLAELATALEITPDELKESITHTFRAADEDLTVTLAELEKGYQKDADYRRQTGQLAEARRQAEQDYNERMQAYEQSNVITAQAYQVAENLIAAELNDPRLAQLRESDPAEWTARREELGQRVNQLRGARTQAAQQYENFRQQQQVELRQREQNFLSEKLPDFGKEHVTVARGAMSSLGYSDQEIGDIFDHRLVLGALELASLRSEVEQLRAMKTKAADTVKRVKKDVPKLQKPGRQQLGRKGIPRNNVQKLKERARKSGKVEDAARVIESMMG